ncbi:MAG: formate dehydrogenase accessory sulfurtransferase FdhD [Longimicrobiaceae bacterium]
MAERDAFSSGSELRPPQRERRRASTTRRPVEQVVVQEGRTLRRTRRDALATEEPLEIRVVRAADLASEGKPQQVAHPLAVTMRTPGADFELAAGFLFGEGVIESGHQVAAIRYCVDTAQGEAQQYNVVNVFLTPEASFDPATLQRHFYTTSSCGVCGKASIEAVWGPVCVPIAGEVEVSAQMLLALPSTLRASQAVFERTGGLHAAALFTPEGELLRVREDVGRHNAMDKLVGAALLAGELLLSEAVLLVSGRLSFELVQKAARAGVPVLAGVSAPSSLAVELAEEVGMTLVGFLREGRFNVYTGGRRIRTAELDPTEEEGDGKEFSA